MLQKVHCHSKKMAFSGSAGTSEVPFTKEDTAPGVWVWVVKERRKWRNLHWKRETYMAICQHLTLSSFLHLFLGFFLMMKPEICGFFFFRFFPLLLSFCNGPTQITTYIISNYFYTSNSFWVK